jgi:hypothetical protein
MKTKNNTSTSAMNHLALLVKALKETTEQQLDNFSPEEIAWILSKYSGQLAFDLEREFVARKPNPITQTSALDEIIRNNS